VSKLAPGFHLFSTGKVFVRSLVLYQCVFEAGSDEATLLSIERTYRGVGGYRHEASNVDYAIFPRGGTLHLHDLFLTDTFGLTVRFRSGKGQIETYDLKSNVEANPPLLFLSLHGEEEIRLVSHVEANPVV
jgi:hypothetical protein